MWDRELDGKRLTFRLAGINNQNFLMRDEQTGSYWQQITGAAISGPLRGRKLTLVRSDELSFALFRDESPAGEVFQASDPKADYDPNWEAEVSKLKPTPLFHDPRLKDRDVIVGLVHGGEERALPYPRLLEQKLVQDLVGKDPVTFVVGPDGFSVRAFVARHPETGATVEFFRKNQSDWALVDSVTGADWDFRGCALAGALKGKCLRQLDIIKDYWFDWKNYHPNTSIYSR